MVNKICIRPMETEDLIRVYEIEREVHLTPWSKKTLEEEWSSDLTKGFVLLFDHQVIGFYFGWFTAYEANLTNIAVCNQMQGLGYGRLLLEHFLLEAQDRQVEDCFLEVSTQNLKAIKLYESFGFEKTRIRKNYYPQIGHDAYEMKKRKEGIFDTLGC